MRTTSAQYERVLVGVAGDLVCSSCDEELDIHQPDLNRPDRLLGTCTCCGTWYLIDDEARVMLALPDPQTLQRN